MIHTNFIYSHYRKYVENEKELACGTVFYRGKKLNTEQLVSLLSFVKTENEFFKTIQELDGFFFALTRNAGRLFVAVDRIRSIPIYYGTYENDIFVSDDAEWVRLKVNDNNIDDVAKNEFTLTGFVTGNDTLYRNVKQLKPGEVLIADKTNDTIEVKTRKYYKYKHNYIYNELGFKDYIKEHEKKLVKAFSRLISVAAGRTIVVPLSGGYDSRLILLMLKRLGYENIVAFSYGVPENNESIISKKVAEDLDVKWVFIPYDNTLWRNWFYSNERKLYWSFSSGLSSLPHNQDWLAIKYLKENKIIPDDSIFAPGHSADLPSGSRSISNSKLYRKEKINKNLLIKEILDYHYSLNKWSLNHHANKKIYTNKIINNLNPLSDFIDNASAFENFDVTERQAKFIINSVRVYEYFGYDWWLPFWDEEYINFWLNIPIKYRMNQRMYKNYVDVLASKISADDYTSQEVNFSYTLNFKKLLRSLFTNSFKNKIKKIKRKSKKQKIDEYYKHPLAFWGVFDICVFLQYKKNDENINSALVKVYIDELLPNNDN